MRVVSFVCFSYSEIPFLPKFQVFKPPKDMDRIANMHKVMRKSTFCVRVNSHRTFSCVVTMQLNRTCVFVT